MARGHHHRSRREERDEEHREEERKDHEREEHRADGGHVMSYTADSNVEKEAEGARRKEGGRVRHEVKHERTGEHRAEHHRTGHRHRTGHPSELHVHEHHHEHLKSGGKVRRKKKEVAAEGERGQRRLDRPGRKRGGAVGADLHPLSSASRGHGGHTTEEQPI